MRHDADRAPDNSQREREELDAVLESEAFATTPTLTRFLTYICTRHFEGRHGEIKEYNIAVDALGRTADFNPEKDSVVRVEAYRLRKRLRRYYRTEGVDRPLEIVIPPGHYVPIFVPRGTNASSRAETDAHDPPIESIPVRSTRAVPFPPAPDGSRGADPDGSGRADAQDSESSRPARPGLSARGWTLVSVLCALLVAVALASESGMFTRTAEGVGAAAVVKPEQNSVAEAAVLAPGTDIMRIMAGSWNFPYVDMEGRTWLGDRYFEGGEVVTSATDCISGGWDDELFCKQRVGDFRYDIPLAAGQYELSLYFAETVFGPGNPGGRGEVTRLFDVAINGDVLLKEFDIIADAGGANSATIRVFRDVTPAPDGYLHLEFRSVRGPAALSGLEVKPLVASKIAPIRILAGRSTYLHDRRQQSWGPDRFFSGGQTVARPHPVTGAPDPNVYSAERYGNFTYTLPVPDGKYKLTLGFAETWFGNGNPGGGGAGSRVFDVYCNGTVLLNRFDIIREAGGGNRAIEKTFHGITPNAQGKIVLSFVPVANYACLNVIELEDETIPELVTKLSAQR